MTKQVRHFVSQRFGKATVRVEPDAAAGGVVSIVLPGDDAKPLAFTFAAHGADPEAIMRLAIGQAHKLFQLHGADDLFGATLPLAAGTAPWIGDLSDAAYGGATVGYAPDNLACPAQ